MPKHYDLIALLVEKLTSRTYVKYVSDKILEPLEMKHTSASVDAVLSSDDFAESY